jgi:hypothetical protein
MNLIHSFTVLNLVANSDTPSTENALVVVPFEKRILTPDAIVVLLTFKPGFSHSIIIGILFKCAGPTFLTGHAIVGMIRKQEFKNRPPSVHDPLRVRSNHHFVGYGISTGSHKRSSPFNLYHTHAARSRGREIRAIAEVGYLNSNSLGRLKNRHPLFGCHLTTVYVQTNLCHVSFPSL